MARAAFLDAWNANDIELSKQAEGTLQLIGLPGLQIALDQLFGSWRRKSASTLMLAAANDLEPAPELDEARPGSRADDLLARARIALANGAPRVALTLIDKALAIDPGCEEAWLVKADCLTEPRERLACLQLGLGSAPSSTRLRQAIAELERTLAG